jgi:hypothetical protein
MNFCLILLFAGYFIDNKSSLNKEEKINYGCIDTSNNSSHSIATLLEHWEHHVVPFLPSFVTA